MISRISPILLVLCFVFCQTIQAQDTNSSDQTAHYDGGFLSHLNIAVGVSTMGLNIEAATPLTSNLKLRAGLNFASFTSDKYDIDLDDPDKTLYNAFGVTPHYELQGDFKTTHSHFLVDYYPFKKGIFHITAGVYVGKTRFKANGELLDDTGKLVELVNGYEWPVIEFDGHILDINQGRLDAELKFGNTVKPYLGIGLGRAISKKRLGVKFELGVLYQGEYSISQHNQVIATTRDVTASVSDADDYTKWLNLWPMINLQLNYRIF